ncbi:hypothetical protein [Terrabacter sp. NPDC080008]|uniref:hypothetical protein n=1 Tax=Terrabacter sp. NPDC080008 TaxID=3155176 RepID=UPI00344EA0A5
MSAGPPPSEGPDAGRDLTPSGGAGLRALLEIGPFRNLFAAGTVSSFGDWLALLATTALAAELAPGGVAEYLAVSGVFVLRIAPAVVLGSLAGVVADRLDRRLVPPDRLELANQLGLVGSYGTAPVAAVAFSGLSLLAAPPHSLLPGLDPQGTFLAMYVNGATFVLSAVIVWRTTFPERGAGETLAGESILRTVTDGLVVVRERPFVRGLLAGMTGTFAAGGLVIGLATRFASDLGAGAPGYGLLFLAVFTGMAAGIVGGPRLLAGFSRPRVFGAALASAGVLILLLALLPAMAAALPLAVLLGAVIGVAWVVGYTLLGLTMEDEVRGRTFALVQSLDRVVLVLVLAAAPLLAAAFEALLPLPHRFRLGPLSPTYTGATAAYLLAGLALVGAGLAAWRTMNDRPGLSVLAEVRDVRRRRRLSDRGGPP